MSFTWGLALATPIDRQALISGHNPSLKKLDVLNPFTLGNGQFAFTADVTGLQSFYDLYYEQGTPIETKARWAWHSRPNPKKYTLDQVMRVYDAYGIRVPFPTDMDSTAGQWLRQNPHDLPLAKVGLMLRESPLDPAMLGDVQQTLDMWRGHLTSHYTLQKNAVNVETVVGGRKDVMAATIQSPLIRSGELAISLQFPRGYKLNKKNTPAIDWQSAAEHTTSLLESDQQRALFSVTVDDHQHFVQLHWRGDAKVIRVDRHRYALKPIDAESDTLEISIEFSQSPPTSPSDFAQVSATAQSFWSEFWQSGAAISFAKSTHPLAEELERRVVLSQYLLAVQAQAEIPAQETGLTSSSWYGKHHTEMVWWHTAHWIMWNRTEPARKTLNWFVGRMDEAKSLARSRGLAGTRWAKMVGPEGIESPGGNPLIIWNQPQPIHLAELLYQQSGDTQVLKRYAALVENTAQALSSMLVWEEDTQRFSLLPPIWIAQEIYSPTATKNPAFELSYWRYGLETALEWRKRLGEPTNTLWERQLRQLAPLPQKDDKYVAIESIPDTFDNIQSRQDHPTMLAPWGLLQDPNVDLQVMQRTLQAVLDSWDWEEKIWGWDYPMIAMTAWRLGKTDLAFDMLLKDAPHNAYLTNGHCPQPGAELPVYLPANGALLSAVAMIVSNWDNEKSQHWNLQAEGFAPAAAK